MGWPSIHVFCNHQGDFSYIIPESCDRFNLRIVQYAIFSSSWGRTAIISSCPALVFWKPWFSWTFLVLKPANKKSSPFVICSLPGRQAKKSLLQGRERINSLFDVLIQPLFFHMPSVSLSILSIAGFLVIIPIQIPRKRTCLVPMLLGETMNSAPRFHCFSRNRWSCK